MKKRIPSHIEMLWHLVLVLCTLLQFKVNAQNATCDTATEQPVVTRVSPPSGTTGEEAGVSSTYIIQGERLDTVLGAKILNPPSLIPAMHTLALQRENFSTISFRIPRTSNVRRMGNLVDLVIYPNNSACQNVTLQLTILDTVILIPIVTLEATPGTTIATGSGTCVPNQCGDNSTTFNIEIGGITLERLNASTPGVVIARFPNYAGAMDRANFVVATQYQRFDLPVSLNFRLQRPGVITSVVPPRGQRGTMITITGQRLLGAGSFISLSSVMLGGTEAEIIESQNDGTSIEIRAGRGGISGIVSLTINTTHTFAQETSPFNGPYIYLENAWTQLEDGLVRDIVPPAAQPGKTVLLCGDRLLGGGTSLDMLLLAGQATSQFNMTPSALSSPSTVSEECITAVVPTPMGSMISGSALLMADTGALVESVNNFTFASINSVMPMSGQPGTIVRIRGVALLSGYDTTVPTVYLSGIQAEVRNYNSTTIEVRAVTPPEPQGSGLMGTLDDQFGTPGNVSIVVSANFTSPTLFSVSVESRWTYLTPGEITSISPNFGQFQTRITINGSNLLGYGSSLERATIGGVNATIESAAESQVILLTPDLGSSRQNVTIILFSDSGATIRGENLFEYREPGIVTSTTPARGQNGTYITISGTNLFGYTDNITSVLLGNVQAAIDYTQANNTSIVVRAMALNNVFATRLPVTIVANTFALVTSNGAIWTYLVPGSVDTVSPGEGQEGTRIVIIGTNLLGGGTSVERIFLDGVPGEVLELFENATMTRIVVAVRNIGERVPSFFPGQVYIMSDTGAIVFGGTYTHRPSGQITTFSPQRGRRGTRITLSGINLLGFGNTVNRVLVAGTPGSIESFDNTSATISAGNSTAGTQGPIQLIINTGAVITSTTNFTYDPPGVISRVVPRIGAEGTGLLIQGTALTPSTSQVVNITIGGNPVSRIVTATDSEISIIVGPAPAMNPTNAAIVIAADDGSIVDGQSFAFINLTISLPGQDQGQEGTYIDIQLPYEPAANTTNFEPSLNMRVTIDDQEAQVTSVNATLRQITVRAPRARRQGTFGVDVAVESVDRLVARLRNGFTYLPEGTIFDIDPSFGQLGTRVVIRGANLLGGGVYIDMASIAGVPANVIASNNKTVQLTIMQNLPSATYPQLGDIILTANTGATIRRLNGFTLVQPGEITSVSPVTGQIGTRVTINGRNLLQGTSSGNVSSVFLAGIPATIIGIVSATQIVVQASSAAAGPPGQIEVILTSGARIMSPSGITFRYLQAGGVTTVTPNIGPVGTNVIISGTNFLGGGSSISQVFLGGVQGTITSSSDIQINVTAAEGIAGRGDVIIVSNTGTITNGSGLWNYEDLGFITQVSPAIGQQGVVVGITGQALLSTSSSQIVECDIAGIAATRITISSRNAVACVAGRNPNSEMPLTGPVMLTTNTGVVVRSTANATNFTYYSAAINRISQLSGNNGTLVTITGTNLYGYPGSTGDIQRVTFGNVEATVLSRTLSTIQVRVGAFDGVTIGDTVTVLSTSGAVLELPNAWNYTQPRTISEVLPTSGRPGEVAYLFGQSLDLEAATSVSVIVGSVTSHNAQVINSSTIQFTLGVYQGVANPGENLPVQVVYSTGEIILNSSVIFIYNATESMVLSISPRAGSGQAIVEINGTNLLNNQSLGNVTLAGIAATIINATEEMIILEAGTPLNEESSGPVVIQRADGTLVGLAGSPWTYYPTIMPSSVSPRTGQLGTFIEINLSQLNTIPTIDRVSLAGMSAADISLNSTSQILQVRAGPSGQTTLGEITIEFNDNSVLRIPNSWSYQPPVEINSITPGLQGYFNTSIVLEGRHFQAGSVTVAFVILAGVQTIIESQSNTQIRVRIAELRNTSSGPIIGPIVIISSEGATFISSNNFTYIQVNIDRVDPQMGQRGTRVTVTGLGVLLGATNISTFWLGNVEATVLGFNDSSITVSAAAFPTQTNLSDVTYIMNTGAVVTIPNSWRYIVPGEILSVTPTEGNMGTLVTIIGNNLFGGGGQAEMVILNSVPATEIVANFDSLVQVLAGPSTTMLAPGNVQVISDTGAVTESTGTSVEFTYLEPGRITAFSPDEGQNGTRVEVRGMYLHSGERIRRVLLAGVEAEIVSINENDGVSGIPTTVNLIARRPSNLESFSGPVVIESNHNTTTVSTMLFTYRTEGLILAVSPVVGQNRTTVTITGQDLSGGGTAVQQVFLAGVEANIISHNQTTVVVSAGENAIGRTGDVVLVSNTNAYVRRIDGWTYIEQGNVASISPPVGQFGTRVTISGQRLLLGANSVQSVSFDNISAFDVINSSNTSITIRVGRPTSSSAFVTNTVIIRSDLGGVLYQNFMWNFTEPSRILNIDPPSGTSQTVVTVSGINLLGGGTTIMSVTVAGIAATNIQFNSNNVTFRTGLNTQGRDLPPGVIVIESDTGARTESSSQWRYMDDCPPGTYGTTNNCRPCNIECGQCFGPSDFECYTCQNFSLFHPNLNRMQCVPMCANVSTLNRECRDACELNQYVRVDSTQIELFCYNCSELCDPNRQCSGPGPTECGACRFFYNTLNGSCVEECPIGTYSNESNNCLPCDRQCTPESGCYGPSAAECFNCANVRVSATLIDDSSSGSHDICLERCPSLYYLDASTQSCFPCATTCAMNCTGPSPFECMACLNNSFVYSNGSRKCIAECNPNSTMQLFYDDMNNVCQRCNDHCSRTGGCTGPTALDCNGCATPMLDGECVISCNNTHYHNTDTNLCVPCHPSCTIGCTGTTVQDCKAPESTAFSAGGGTIAIVIIIIIALVVIVALLLTFLFWSHKKHGKYKVVARDPQQSDTIELGDRYTPACEIIAGKDKEVGESLGISNTGFGEPMEVYSEMGPEEGELEVTKIDEVPDLYTDMSSGDLKKSEGGTGSQDLLYTDMSPAPIDLEEKETTSAPVVPERPPKPGEKPKEGNPPPPDPHIYKVPVARKEDKKPEQQTVAKPPLQCPPTPEMYTDMRGGIQEIHLNPDTGLSQDLYDDVQASTPQSPKTKQEDQAPLLAPTADVLYEDTDTASESAQQYLAQSRKSNVDQVPHITSRQPAEENTSHQPQRTSLGAPLPPLPPRGAADEVPPALPVRPVPKKRNSAMPLPQTPLQQSLSNSNIAGSSTSPTAAQPSIDNIYEETAVPVEESLYEPIPAREQSHLISEPPPQQTKTKDGKGGKQKGGKKKK